MEAQAEDRAAEARSTMTKRIGRALRPRPARVHQIRLRRSQYRSIFHHATLDSNDLGRQSHPHHHLSPEVLEGVVASAIRQGQHSSHHYSIRQGEQSAALLGVSDHVLVRRCSGGVGSRAVQAMYA